MEVAMSFNSLRSVLAVTICLLALLNCSRKEERKASLSITFPSTPATPGVSKSKISALQSTSTASTWGLERPSSISNISCFAVFVEKTGSVNPDQCQTSSGSSAFSYYVAKGFFQAGETVSLEVDVGVSNVILVGASSLNPSVDCVDIVNSINKERYSQPLVLGKANVDLLPDKVNEVDIEASLTTTSVALESCTGIGTQVPSPLPPPNEPPPGTSQDTLSPTLAQPTISISPAVDSVNLSWSAATDDTTDSNLLEYRIFRTAPGTTDLSTINTVALAEAAIAVSDWTPSMVSFLVSSLAANTSYSFAVVVRDQAGNKALYTPIVATTTALTNLAITTPLSGGAYINSTIVTAFSAVGTCPVNGSTISLKIGGASVGCTSLCSSQSGNITNCDLSSQSEGSLNLTVDDGSATSPAIAVIKDVTPPTAPSSLVVGTVVGILSETPMITWVSSSDSGTGVASHEVQLIEVSSPPLDLTGWNSTSSGFKFTGLNLTAGQSYFFRVRARDQANNLSSEAASATWVAQGIANKLGISGFTSDSVGTCRIYSIDLLDSSNASVNATATVNIALAMSSGSGGFYSNNTCTNSISTTTISQYTGSTVFFFQSWDSGSHTIQATDSAGILSAATKTITRNLISLSVAPVYPSSGANWNDYTSYSNGSFDSNHQSDTACTGSETGRYGELGGCIHAGERRKVVVSGVTSCTNLSASDDLNAFEWGCEIDSGNATFYSKGLASGKGLRDLFSGAGGAGSWTANRVIVRLSSNPIGESPLATWWTNSITPLPASSGSLTTLNSSTIYYTFTNQSAFGYLLESPKMAIVTLGNSEITYSGNSGLVCSSTAGGAGSVLSPILCGGVTSTNQRFLWVEAKMNGYSGTWNAHGGIVAVNWKFSRIHRTSVANLHPNSSATGASGIYLRSSQGNFVSGFELYSASDGIRLYGSDNNTFKDLSVSKVGTTSAGCNGGCSLIMLEQGSDSNRFYQMRLANATDGTKAYGINISMGMYNIFSQTMISNIAGSSGINPTSNASEGVFLSGTSTSYNIFSQLTVNGTKDAGVYLYNSANNNIFSHFTSTNNIYNGIYFNGASIIGNHFNSIALINSAKPVESVATSSSANNIVNAALKFNPGGTYSSIVSTASTGAPTLTFNGYLVRDPSDSCTGNETNLSSSCTAGALTTISGSGWNSAFYGTATSDSVNTYDASGSASYSILTSAAAWQLFENPFRSWGLQGPMSSSSRGVCNSGSCAIWDLRASAGGPLYNRSLDGQSANGDLNLDGAHCNSLAIDGSATSSAAGKTFLRNAIEIIEDAVGDDNGLCEANEDCLWAPNIGSYQGYSTPTAGYCNLGDGAGSELDGIRIFKYSIQ